MNLNTLKYYLAVCERRNFTKAAEDLFITQPTLSRAIASLEEEIGETLIIRGKRSLSLTPAGEVCLKEAKEILHRCDSLPEYVRKNSHNMHGTLRIGYISQMEQKQLWDLTRRFSLQYPHVSVQLIDRPDVLKLHQMLKDGQLDALYTSTIDPSLHSDIYAEQFLFRNRLCVLISKNHPLITPDRTMISIKELKEEPFIIHNRSVFPTIFDAEITLCRENGFSPNAVDYVDSVKSLILAVAAEKGVGFLTEKFYGYMDDNICIVPLEENISFDISLIWKTSEKSAELKAYIEMAQQNQWS